MKTILIALLLLVYPVLSFAGALQDALDAYEKKDYAVSHDRFTAIAEGPDESVFLKAAKGDNPGVPRATLVGYWRENYGPKARSMAHAYLGVIYLQGFGLPQNYIKALGEFEKAALDGIPSAEHNLALMYDSGKGVAQDLRKAVYWYEKAAHHGHPGSMNNLGTMYSSGTGVPQNFVFAHKWYNLAAARLDDSDERLVAAKNRDGLARRMTPGQISEAQYLASQWKVKE